jgi:hypothetical protein
MNDGQFLLLIYGMPIIIGLIGCIIQYHCERKGTSVEQLIEGMLWKLSHWKIWKCSLLRWLVACCRL